MNPTPEKQRAHKRAVRDYMKVKLPTTADGRRSREPETLGEWVAVASGICILGFVLIALPIIALGIVVGLFR